jgi:hypothetical protein
LGIALTERSLDVRTKEATVATDGSHGSELSRRAPPRDRVETDAKQGRDLTWFEQ